MNSLVKKVLLPATIAIFAWTGGYFVGRAHVSSIGAAGFTDEEAILSLLRALCDGKCSKATQLESHVADWSNLVAAPDQ